MKARLWLAVAVLALAQTAGATAAKHVVLLAGDEEYRSEEGLPMLAKILEQRLGFKTTVLFSVDPDGTIDPNRAESLSDPAALDSADAIVMQLRFRHWNNGAMRRFQAAVQRGAPIVALRTSTHAFAGLPRGSAWENWNYDDHGGWGKRVLGETWVSHWGRHMVEATRAVAEPSVAGDPLLRGVSNIFTGTDVYEADPPRDARILLRGIVLSGMGSNDPPAQDMKRRASDHGAQSVNDPPMPVAWTRVRVNESGHTNRILCITMGSAADLENQGLRRLIINGVLWGLKLPIPEKADVSIVGNYHPSASGFDGYRRGVRAQEGAGSAP